MVQNAIPVSNTGITKSCGGVGSALDTKHKK
jgi:hypothetical protein